MENVEELEFAQHLEAFLGGLTIGERKEMRKKLDGPDDIEGEQVAILWMAMRKAGEEVNYKDLFRLTETQFNAELERVIPLAGETKEN